MPIQIVMDKTGDTRHDFDTTPETSQRDPESIRTAVRNRSIVALGQNPLSLPYLPLFSLGMLPVLR
jgi:hypothetical protein